MPCIDVNKLVCSVGLERQFELGPTLAGSLTAVNDVPADTADLSFSSRVHPPDPSTLTSPAVQVQPIATDNSVTVPPLNGIPGAITTLANDGGKSQKRNVSFRDPTGFEPEVESSGGLAPVAYSTVKPILSRQLVTQYSEQHSPSHSTSTSARTA